LTIEQGSFVSLLGSVKLFDAIVEGAFGVTLSSALLIVLSLNRSHVAVKVVVAWVIGIESAEHINVRLGVEFFLQAAPKVGLLCRSEASAELFEVLESVASHWRSLTLLLIFGGFLVHVFSHVVSSGNVVRVSMVRVVRFSFRFSFSAARLEVVKFIFGLIDHLSLGGAGGAGGSLLNLGGAGGAGRSLLIDEVREWEVWNLEDWSGGAG